MQAFDRAALDALPVFPLPDIALFPSALLPLHVFEPRYRSLTADVLSTNRLMAVARLRPGYERHYEARPPMYGVAGIGYLTESERLPDGRYLIALRGLARIAIDHEVPSDRQYRLIRASVLDDRVGDDSLLRAAHQRVIALCDQLSLVIEKNGDKLRELVRSPSSPGACADVISAALVADPDERQSLLEMLDPAERLDRVAGMVAELLVRLTPRSGSSN
jgi:Lon protease-like protein